MAAIRNFLFAGRSVLSAARRTHLPVRFCHTLRRTSALCCTSHPMVNIAAFVPKHRGDIADLLGQF
jgi:hypothetical protein